MLEFRFNVHQGDILSLSGKSRLPQIQAIHKVCFIQQTQLTCFPDKTGVASATFSYDLLR